VQLVGATAAATADGFDYLLTVMAYRAEEDPSFETEQAVTLFLVGGGWVPRIG
jgi:hypothetical protein